VTSKRTKFAEREWVIVHADVSEECVQENFSITDLTADQSWASSDPEISETDTESLETHSSDTRRENPSDIDVAGTRDDIFYRFNILDEHPKWSDI